MKKMLVMDPQDNVGVVLEDIEPGDECYFGTIKCTAKDKIPFGHKIALTSISNHEDVLKYGHKIGYATRPIEKGMWVHRHNIESERGR